MISVAHNPEEKLKIVLEGLTKDITITDLCNKYDISRETYYTWKKELENGALKNWSKKTPGRNGKNHFDDKSKAEKAYQKTKKELEQKNEKIYELKKKLEGVTLQRDFAQFRYQNRVEDDDDDNSSKKK